MHPELMHIETAFGLFEISSYSFFLWIAILVVSFGMYRRCRAHQISRRKSVLLSVGMMVAAVVGARLLHVVTNISMYLKYPARIVALDAQGLSLVGAVILVSLLGLLIGRITHVPVWKLSDEMVPFIGISIVIARIGCFLNGCCFGAASNLPWAVRFPIFSDAHLHQLSLTQTDIMTSLPVHPTQLYEALGALISMFLAGWAQKKKKMNGAGILVFVASFSVVRLITHYVRVFPDSFEGVRLIFPALYIGILFYCLLLLFQGYSPQKGFMEGPGPIAENRTYHGP